MTLMFNRSRRFYPVVSCAPNIPIRQIVMGMAQPAIMISYRIIPDENEYSR